MDKTQDRLLTPQQTADFLGLKVATVRRLTYTRELPVVRPTGKRAVRYRLAIRFTLRRFAQPSV